MVSEKQNLEPETYFFPHHALNYFSLCCDANKIYEPFRRYTITDAPRGE